MTEDIKKLSDYSHSRLRTEMYLGSRSPHSQQVLLYDNDRPTLEEVTWVPATFTAFREVFDNALDEVVGHSHGNRIDIEYDETSGITSISDNGRGIPFDIDPTEGIPKATMAMTHARAGRNFGERGEVAGTNGIGASAVNFCSEWFKMEITRDNKKFVQEFHEGNAVIDALQIKPHTIRELKSDKTGTKITFKLSDEVFSSKILPLRFIQARVFEVAVINSGTTFYFNGERIKVKPSIEKTLFEKDKIITIDIKEDGFKSKFIVKPGFYQGSDFYYSVVNNIPAFNGGHHIDAFRRGFIAGILAALDKEARRRKLTPNRSDVGEGLLVFNVTQMRGPNFDAQSKTRLINEEAGKFVAKALSDENLFKDILRKNKEWVDEIFARTAERTNRKDADELAKASKKLSRKKVPKLTDATSAKRSDCILFLAEGDCLYEETPILILDDEHFGPRKLKDVKIGDTVVTHSHSVKQVTNISRKVVDGISINLKNGSSLIVSHNHRLMVYFKLTNAIGWLEAKSINPKEHQMVRSRIVDIDGFWEINNIETNEDDQIYPLSLNVTDVQGNTIVMQSSKTHKFAIFDMERLVFEMLPAEQLDSEKHCLLAIQHPQMEKLNEI